MSDPNNQKVLPQQNSLSSRDRFVKTLYENYKEFADKPVVMTISEFRRYEPLFSRKVQQQLLHDQLPEGEAERIRELSQEWGIRINLRKPVHITDDNGNPLFTLPPALMHFNELNFEQARLLDIIASVAVDDEQQYSVIGQKKQAALDALTQLAQMSQDPKVVAAETSNFNQCAKSVHTFTGKDIDGSPLVANNTSSTTNKTTNTDNTQDDDDLCFD